MLSAQVYAGQYLPDWRPGRDYRSVYSADSIAGGGVLRDLSHELDYLNWIFGGWAGVTALGGKLSSLELSSEDTVAVLIGFRACPVATLQINYLDRSAVDRFWLNTDRRDPRSGSGQRMATLRIVVGISFRAIHRRDRTTPIEASTAPSCSGEHDELCTAEEAQEVLRLIAAIEEAMAAQAWVLR